MKKLILGTLLVLISANSHAQVLGQPVGTRTASRLISDTTDYEDAKVEVEVTPGSQANLRQSVPVKYVRTRVYNNTYITRAATVVPVFEGYTNVEVPVGPCEVVPGNGSNSPLWNAYFNGGGDKGVALANAIKGIGEKTGRRIVADKRFFISKPRTWAAFANEVTRATDAGLIAPNAKTDILSTYRQANEVNLGYVVRTNCPTQIVQKQVWDLVEIPAQTEVRAETTKTNREQDTVYVWLEIDVTNPTLQSFEKDRLTVSTDRQGNIRVNQSQAWTRYSVKSEQISAVGTRVKIVGQGRNLETARPDLNDIFAQKPQLIQEGTSAFIVYEINSKYAMPAGNPEVRFNLIYHAQQTAGPSSFSFQDLPANSRRSESLPANNRWAKVPVWGAGMNRTLKTDVSIQFVNSKWYTGAPLFVGTLERKLK